MSAAALLSELNARGFRLIANPPAVRVIPGSRLTDADRQAIRACKAELLRLLTQPEPPPKPEPPPTVKASPSPSWLCPHARVVWQCGGCTVAYLAEYDRLRDLGASPDEAESRALASLADAPAALSTTTAPTPAPPAPLRAPLTRPEPELEPAVAAELARVWPEAERLGWPHSLIFGNRFWPVEARGLACLLDTGDRLGAVTRDFIAIVKKDGAVQRYRKCHA